MVKKLIFLIFRAFFHIRHLGKANIRVGGHLQFFRSTLAAKPDSVIEMGKNVILMNSTLLASGNSVLRIGDNSILKNVQLTLDSYSDVTISSGAVLNYADLPKGIISVNTGHILIGEKANLKANISVRFGGKVSLGFRSGIGYGSEIVCDERIHLGDYCLVSNYVSIYDTNSHSVDFQERRERITIGYPDGCSEVVKPKTSPIHIGNDVWIGKNATILKGVTIGDQCIVGIAATVTKGSYPAKCSIVSNQSRVINN